MAMYFSMCDVMQTAVGIEQNGERFYSTLAGKLKSPAVKKIFVALGKEEQAHIGKFQDIYNAVEKKPLVCEFDNETIAYIKALSAEVFSEAKFKAIIKKKGLAEKDAVQYAIDFEKNTMLFFREIRDLVELHD
ncbi:MAG: ferritin family protein, partial [Candidatus Thermoplasmatota archaeon]|nr:ferritin family protein [Candidatus Thermoplasmatota archaeon]